MSNNASGAANQQETQKIFWGSSETTRQAPQIKAYLLGALHDGTFSSNKRFRISQSGTDCLRTLQRLFRKLGYNSWIYKEGKHRRVYVLETLADFLDFKFNPLTLREGECMFLLIHKKLFWKRLKLGIRER